MGFNQQADKSTSTIAAKIKDMYHKSSAIIEECLQINLNSARSSRLHFSLFAGDSEEVQMFELSIFVLPLSISDQLLAWQATCCDTIEL